MKFDSSTKAQLKSVSTFKLLLSSFMFYHLLQEQLFFGKINPRLGILYSISLLFTDTIDCIIIFSLFNLSFLFYFKTFQFSILYYILFSSNIFQLELFFNSKSHLITKLFNLI